MDAIELAALEYLGSRPEWDVRDLPESVDVDVLRCLDHDGLVEVANVRLSLRRSAGSEHAESVGRWFSPTSRLATGPSWDEIFDAPPVADLRPPTRRTYTVETPLNDFGGYFPRSSITSRRTSIDHGPCAYRVRLTNNGRVRFSRAQRASATDAPATATPIQTIAETDTSHAIAQHPADAILRYLTEYGDEPFPVADLPAQHREARILTLADADGLVEFGTRRHYFFGPDHELRVEPGWDFGSITGPACKPIQEYITETLAFDGDDRIRQHVQLTRRARIRVARLNVEVAAVHSIPKLAKSGMQWREIRRQLLEMYDNDEPYVSTKEFADRLGCSKSTIQKAFKNSTQLTAWRARYRSTNVAPRAISINEVVADNAIQTSEVNPAMLAELNEEDDLIFNRLVQEARTDEQRAELHAMSPDQRRGIIAVLKENPDQGNRTLDRRP